MTTEAISSALRALGRLPAEDRIVSDGAVLTIKPREEGLLPKEIPVDAFLKKVVSMRDKLRVLEQRVNASNLEVDEKIRLEADITQMYQAIATFSAFFTKDALFSESE